MDPDTGNLDTTFSSDGVADAPSNQMAGITFFTDSALWAVSNDGFDIRLYKISATTGAVLATINLSNCPSPCSIFDPVGGLTNDGTNLVALMRDGDFSGSINEFVFLDISGLRVGDDRPSGPATVGGDTVAFLTSKAQYFTANGSIVVQWPRVGSDITFANEFDTSPGLAAIRGLTADQTAELLYLGHVDAGQGKISTAAPPSPITNNPRGLTVNASGTELFILVDGKGQDHIVVVDPNDGSTTPAVLRDFPVPGEEKADAITFLNGSLYVGVEGEGFFGSPLIEILQMNPTTGTVLSRLSPSQDFRKVLGLANDGTNLVATREFGGPHVDFLDPTNGSLVDELFFFDPFDPLFFEDGFQGVAIPAAEKEFLPIKGDTVFRFDDEGRLRQEFTTALAQLRGAVFVGNTMYLAEDAGNTIRTTKVPTPPTTITNTPTAMAQDGTSTNLYITVDASPVDRIIKVDPNDLDSITSLPAFVTDFGTGGVLLAPGGDVGGMAFHNGFLYLVDNGVRNIDTPTGVIQVQVPVLFKIDSATGAVLQQNPFALANGSTPEILFNLEISSLASDGTLLFGGARGGGAGGRVTAGTWFQMDPDAIVLVAAPGAPFPIGAVELQPVTEFAGVLPFMSTFEAFEITQGQEFPTNRELVASGDVGVGNADAIARSNKDTGVMFQQFDVDPSDTINVTGMAYIDRTLFMADTSTANPFGTAVVRGTSLPDRTVETTIAGNYTGQLSVTTTEEGTKASPVSLFSIVRNPNVVVEITEPLDSFAVTTDDATITGRISDPSIQQAQVSIDLPFTLLVDDSVVRPDSDALWTTTSGAAQWHIACGADALTPPARVNSPDCSWRYAKDGGPDFDTGAPTAGTMTSVGIFAVSIDTFFAFDTWYDTQTGPNRDKKLVEVAVVTTDLQGNDVVGPFQAIRQIVGRGFGGSSPPTNAHPSFQFVEIDPLLFDGSGNPIFTGVNIPLSPFAGQRVQVRFNFDSVDQFANNGEGWYNDDITLAGSGRQTILVPTTLLPVPVVDGTSTFFRTFTTPFTLAEGPNTVLAVATQPYTPFLSGSASLGGDVDKTSPAVTLFGIASPTNNLLQNLQGTIADLTLQLLEVQQVDSAGTRTVLTLTSVPAGGAFSVPVSLNQGLNTFIARATDAGGLVDNTNLAVLADTTPPDVDGIGVIIPIGEISARPGDEVILDASATDTVGGSGVSQVLFFTPETTVGTPMLPVSSIPAAVVDAFQITGQAAAFLNVPLGLPAGTFSVDVRAQDAAGNLSAPTTVAIKVVTTLEAFNIRLMPGFGYVSTPVQCFGLTVAGGGVCHNDGDLSYDIRAVMEQVVPNANPAWATAKGLGVVKLKDIVETVQAWPGGFAGTPFEVVAPGLPQAAGELEKLRVMRGYIIKTRETENVGTTTFNVFRTSPPIAPGFPDTPTPIKLTLKDGAVLKAGGVPPTENAIFGWNLKGLHSENSTLAARPRII